MSALLPLAALLTSVALAAPEPAGEPSLVLDRQLPWAGGTHLRFTPYLGDLPVEGREVVVSLDHRGEVRRVHGEAVGATLDDPIPSVPSRRAEVLAAEVADLFGVGRPWAPRSELVAWIDRDDHPHLAWAVDVAVARPFTTFRVLVDAHDGALLHTTPTSRSALADVYAVNPVLSEISRVELAGLDESGALSGEYIDVYSCEVADVDEGLFGASFCEEVARHAQPDEAGDFLFEPDPASLEDPFAEVQLYYQADLVSRFFDERFGFRHPEPLRGIVNFEMTNAFWGDFDGDGVADLSFGTGRGGVDFAYDGEVVYHEFGHSVVHGISSVPFVGADEYGMNWTGGGLDEGSADTAAMLLSADPLMAEYAGTWDGGDEPIRDLTELRHCPEHLFGEVHHDGEILGALFWQLIDDPLVGVEVAGDLWYGAVSTWTMEVDWPTAGVSILDAAADLLDAGVIDTTTHDQVVVHLESTGILDCGRVVPLDTGEVSTHMILNGGLLGDFAVIPLDVQFSYEVPADLQGLRVEITDFSSGSDQLGWALYMRRGEHVVHDVTTLGAVGIAFATPVVYDHLVEGSEAGVALELTPTSEPPLEPGATYYFSMGGTNLGGLGLLEFTTGRISVKASPFEPEVEEEEPGGCGCASGGALGSAWGLLVALVGLHRRRRPGAQATRSGGS